MLASFSALPAPLLSFVAEYSTSKDINAWKSSTDETEIPASFRMAIEKFENERTDPYYLVLRNLRRLILEKEELVSQKQAIEKKELELSQKKEDYKGHISSSFFKKTVAFFKARQCCFLLSIIGKLFQIIFPCIAREVNLQNAKQIEIENLEKDYKTAAGDLKRLNLDILKGIKYKEEFYERGDEITCVNLKDAKKRLMSLESFCRRITDLFEDARIFNSLPVYTTSDWSQFIIHLETLTAPITRIMDPNALRYMFAVKTVQTISDRKLEGCLLYCQKCDENNLTLENFNSLIGQWPFTIDDERRSKENREILNRVRILIQTGSWIDPKDGATYSLIEESPKACGELAVTA